MSDTSFNEVDQERNDDPQFPYLWADDDETVEAIMPDENEFDTFEDSEFDVDDDEPYIPF